MIPSAVLCIAKSEEQVLDLVAKLKTAHFFTDDISVLFADNRRSRRFAYDHYTKGPPGEAVSSGTGGIVGGLLGLVAGAGALTLPMFEIISLSGPIIAALGAAVGVAGAGGAAIGATVGGAMAYNHSKGSPVGGIAGALITLGISTPDAMQIAEELDKGEIMVSVHARDPDAINLAKTIFTEGMARRICVASQPEPVQLP
jgi:hypothetical protein